MSNDELRNIYNDPEALRAIRLLSDKGYTPEQVADAYKNGLIVSEVLTKED